MRARTQPGGDEEDSVACSRLTHKRVLLLPIHREKKKPNNDYPEENHILFFIFDTGDGSKLNDRR